MSENKIYICTVCPDNDMKCGETEPSCAPCYIHCTSLHHTMQNRCVADGSVGNAEFLKFKD